MISDSKMFEEVLRRYLNDKTLDDLYARYKKTDLGYGKDDVANPDGMLIYYSKDKIDQYGVWL